MASSNLTFLQRLIEQRRKKFSNVGTRFLSQKTSARKSQFPSEASRNRKMIFGTNQKSGEKIKKGDEMEQRTFKIVNNCLNTNIYSYLETSGGKSYNLYLKVVHFSTPVFIRYLWQLKTFVLVHWFVISAVLLNGGLNHRNQWIE